MMDSSVFSWRHSWLAPATDVMRQLQKLGIDAQAAGFGAGIVDIEADMIVLHHKAYDAVRRDGGIRHRYHRLAAQPI